MTSCGRGRDTATPECFGRGSQGTIFVRSSKISLFFRELCSFQRVFFCFPRAFVRFGAKRSSAGAFGFNDALELFLKICSVTGRLFANSDYGLEYFLKITFLFQSRAGLTCLTAMVIPRLSKNELGDGRSKIRMKTSLPGVARPSAEEPSIVVAIGTCCLR